MTASCCCTLTQWPVIANCCQSTIGNLQSLLIVTTKADLIFQLSQHLLVRVTQKRKCCGIRREYGSTFVSSL